MESGARVWVLYEAVLNDILNQSYFFIPGGLASLAWILKLFWDTHKESRLA